MVLEIIVHFEINENKNRSCLKMKHKQKRVYINKLVRRDRLEKYIKKCLVDYCSQQSFYDICDDYFYKYYLEYIKTWTGAIPSTTNSDFWETVISDCISTGHNFNVGHYGNGWYSCIYQYHDRAHKPKKLEYVKYTEWVKELVLEYVVNYAKKYLCSFTDPMVLVKQIQIKSRLNDLENDFI